MLINKWLVIDQFDHEEYQGWEGGLCLQMQNEPGDIDKLYKNLQFLKKPFALLLSGNAVSLQDLSPTFIEKVVPLFFQPCYYLVNGCPLIFLDSEAPEEAKTPTRLLEKCRQQGLHLVTRAARDQASASSPSSLHVYHIASPDIQFDRIIQSWLFQYANAQNPDAIHFLIPGAQPALTELLTKMVQSELILQKTENYKLADTIYQREKLIEEYKHDLEITISMKNDLEFYLEMQKKQMADNVAWYHNEYEILPTWYKRTGHIIKVLMGRRSFLSLFNDKVKKYKD